MRNIFKRIIKLFSKKVKQKTYENWFAKAYNSTPLVSFVIQSHNRSENVCTIIDKLRFFENSEIIVIDDGSAIIHTNRIIEKLSNANEFVFRCNDIYEVITYDRAIYLSRGKYVVLLQDDDDFENLDWVNEGIQHFVRDHTMVILGGRDGGKFLPFDVTEDKKRGEFTLRDNIAARNNSFKLELAMKEGFHYVQYVNRAPMWIRRETFIISLKTIDIRFAPFQWDDAELCLRAWNQGLKVGIYNANFKLGALGLGGMQIWNNELHHRQDEVNALLLYEMYENSFEFIDGLVAEANQKMQPTQ